MNAVTDLQTAQDALQHDFQQRMAKLQAAQAEAQRIIDEVATLESATEEKTARANQKAQAIDNLNDAMVAPIEHSKRTVAAADEARAKITEAQRTILAQRDILQGVYHEAAVIAGEVAAAVQSNKDAFDSSQEAKAYAVSKLMALLPMGINSVGDEQMLYRYREAYKFPSFGHQDQQRLISQALVMIR